MFGPSGGAVVFDLPDSRSMAAVSPAVTNSGALSRFEAHELFESSDLTAIAGRAQGITYRPPRYLTVAVASRRQGTGEDGSVMADTATDRQSRRGSMPAIA